MSENDSVLRDFNGRIAVECKIKRFFDLRQKLDDPIESPTFLLSNARWCLVVYPNGVRGGREYIVLCLARKTETTDVHHLSFTLGMKKMDGSVFRSFDQEYMFDKVYNTLSRPEFLTMSELLASKNVLTIDGTVTFFCAARVRDLHVRDDHTKESASQTSPDGVQDLSKDFKILFLSERVSDVKIKVRDMEFKAHKSVLVARSPVFASMFEHEMIESSSGVVDVIDCEPESFQNFILFLYSGKMDDVPSSNLVGLYKTADKYDVKELKEMCRHRLADEMSVDLVCDVVHLAVMYKETELLNIVTQFFIDNVHNVLNTAKWEAFMGENTSMAKELLIKMANHYKPEQDTNE